MSQSGISGSAAIKRNDLHVSKFIVGDTSNGANYATIPAALAAVSSGDIICLQQGTYIGDFTLPAGITLTALNGGQVGYRFANTFNVKIKGKISASFTGTSTIANICLETNGDSCVSVTGSSDTRVVLNNCFINVADAVAALNLQSTGGHDFVMAGCYGAIANTSGYFFNCAMETTCDFCFLGFDVGASGTNLFTAHSQIWNNCIMIGNTTVSNGAVFNAGNCEFSGTWTFNDTSKIDWDYVYAGVNVSFNSSNASSLIINCDLATITTTGTGTLLVATSSLEAGTSSAISVGAGSTVKCYGSTIDSSNTNAITGAGTIQHAGNSFANSSTINTTTQIGGQIPQTAGTTGQVLTSNGAGTPPTYATLPYTQLPWSIITANQTAAVQNGYICNKASELDLALPATSAVGDIIRVTGINTALGWKITQASGQQIFFGNQSTTLGATGFLQSAATRDTVEIVCITANTTWQVISSIGNVTIA